jgi:hypothetical protein
MTDGGEFYAQSVFAVGTFIEGVFQGDGIEDGECCCESEKEQEGPAGADLALFSIESIEPVHSESYGQKTE